MDSVLKPCISYRIPMNILMIALPESYSCLIFFCTNKHRCYLCNFELCLHSVNNRSKILSHQYQFVQSIEALVESSSISYCLCLKPQNWNLDTFRLVLRLTLSLRLIGWQVNERVMNGSFQNRNI